jgi:hypothetical protein
MDHTTIGTMLDTLAQQRAEFVDLPATMLAAILHHLSPDDAARIQGIVDEFKQRETQLQAEIAQTEGLVKAYVLATGASAHGTYLQATIMAPRVTWDTKALHVYSTLHPDILPYRKVGEPSVTIRTRALKR